MGGADRAGSSSPTTYLIPTDQALIPGNRRQGKAAQAAEEGSEGTR